MDHKPAVVGDVVSLAVPAVAIHVSTLAVWHQLSAGEIQVLISI
eukprot:COSAG02_NODE_27976_length_599_cov_0.662000_1_plen_44_part_00